SRAAERHKFLPPPAAACRHAASADARRSRPPWGLRAGWAGNNATGAWPWAHDWGEAAGSRMERSEIRDGTSHMPIRFMRATSLRGDGGSSETVPAPKKQEAGQPSIVIPWPPDSSCGTQPGPASETCAGGWWVRPPGGQRNRSCSKVQTISHEGVIESRHG